MGGRTEVHKSRHGAVPPLQPLLQGSRGTAASNWVCRAGDAASSKVRTSSASARVCGAAERATWQAGSEQPVTNSPSPFPPAPSAAGPPPRPRTGRGAPMNQMQAANQALACIISSRFFSSGSPSSPRNGLCVSSTKPPPSSWSYLHTQGLDTGRLEHSNDRPIQTGHVGHKTAALLLVVPAMTEEIVKQVGECRLVGGRICRLPQWPQQVGTVVEQMQRSRSGPHQSRSSCRSLAFISATSASSTCNVQQESMLLRNSGPTQTKLEMARWGAPAVIASAQPLLRRTAAC